MTILLLLYLGIPKPIGHYFEPFAFENEAIRDSLIADLCQVESSDGLLYLRENKDPRILVVDAKGRFLKRIGHKGRNYGELGLFSVAMSVRGKQLWAVDDLRKFVHYFENGERLHEVRLKSYDWRHNITATSEAFAFSDDYLVIPADPNKDHLAYAYNYAGEVVKSFPNVFLEADSPHFAVDKTFWAFDGQFFYCAFKFAPLLFKYDKDLNLLAQFQLKGWDFDKATREAADYDGNRFKRTPLPTIYDLKIYRGIPYVMTHLTLYQIHPQTGDTLSQSRFFNKSEQWAKYNGLGVFEFFTFLNDDTLILGSRVDVDNHFVFKTKPKFSLNLNQVGL